MSAPEASRLRRDLGTLESYATLVGILVGAGIFRVTSDAWRLTGSSVVLGYLVLAPAVLATCVPFAVFVSTPLGRTPGGEYVHISRTFGGTGLAFLGAWLKIISYCGALAYLAGAFADYVLAPSGAVHTIVALATLVAFGVLHALGVRWFGRLQVAMCALLGVSILVLVVPGLFAIRAAHYAPFFNGGKMGFLASLPLLFFSYAGFESLAQTAGEVRNSTRRLPLVFVRGVLWTTLVFFLMSFVAFGVLPGAELAASSAPMTAVARVYLPVGAAWIVTLGALMAIATSLNASMLVPSRLAIMLAADGVAPRWIATIAPRTGTPVLGLALTCGLSAALVASGRVGLALDIAVLALVLLYLLHSIALLVVPRRNPQLYASREVRLPAWLEKSAAWISIASMGGLVAVLVRQDLRTLRSDEFATRAARGQWTSVELLAAWSLLGGAVYVMHRRRRIQSPVSSAVVGPVS